MVPRKIVVVRMPSSAESNASRMLGMPGASCGQSRKAAYTRINSPAGTARTPLRPAGTVEIDGRLVDAVSDGTFLDAGTRVEVVAVEGDRITVAAREESA